MLKEEYSWISMDGRVNPGYFTKSCIKGRSKLEWQEKNNSTEESPSTARFHVMMKINALNYFHGILISKWKSCTNTKVILSNIGPGRRYGGGSFSNFNMK